MAKKVKMSIFATVMSVIMLVTSMSVFAKEKSETISLGTINGTATIGISSDAGTAWASTRGSSASIEILQTIIYGRGSDPFTGYGVTDAEVTGRYEPFNYAESQHAWSGRVYNMYIAP